MTVLSLYEELLAPGERMALPAGERLLYVASGHVAGGMSLAVGEAWDGDAELELVAGGEGATLLRFELTEWGVEGAKLSVPLQLDPWVQHALRGGRGPASEPAAGAGIGCLLAGEVRAGDRTFGPLDAWAEPAELEGNGDVLRVAVVSVE